MTRFFPGEIREAFQNSVPKSMPMTWELAKQTSRKSEIAKKIFINQKLYFGFHT